MARRVWIIAKKDQVEQSDKDDAKAHNCPEIVNGIPLALMGIVLEGDLPCAYEEPEPPIPQPIRDPLAEIDILKAKVAELETREIK